MKKPNLLFIFTDQQRADTLKAYGNTEIYTPNLNTLAEASAVFKNAYVTQPVCTPSRSSIMSGLYPHANGCDDNNKHLDEKLYPSLPKLADFSEYSTAYMGKWHLGDEVFAQHGFKQWVSIEDAYRKHYSPTRDKATNSSYHDFLITLGYKPDTEKRGVPTFSRDFSARLPEEHSKPTFLSDQACRFLENNEANPFLLYVNFLEPHTPYFSCRDNQYQPSEITLPANAMTGLEDTAHSRARFQRMTYAKKYSTKESWQQLIARYYGLISLVDTGVGKIIETLKKLNLYDDTIIVFTSDHGDMMSSHGLLGKCFTYDECCKVPLMIKNKSQHNQIAINNPVCQIDLVPTLLEMLNQPIPSHLHGKSLCPVWQGATPTEDVFYEWNMAKKRKTPEQSKFAEEYPDFLGREEIEDAYDDNIRVIVTQDGWKYAHSAIGQHQLYCLRRDPEERTNLAFEDEYQPLIKDLKQRISEWQKKTGDIK